MAKMKNIFEVEKWFLSEKTLEKVLEYCSKYFVKIDFVCANLRTKPDDIKYLDKAIIQLVGIQGFLEPIAGLANTYKKNEEEVYYRQQMIKLEKGELLDAGGNEVKKLTDAVLKRYASEHVKNYRRVRNLLDSYVGICNSCISAIQSRRKAITGVTE